MRLFSLFSFVLVMVTGATSFALEFSTDGPSETKVREVRDMSDPVFFSMKSVNAVGTTACEENTGQKFSDMTSDEKDSSIFEFCISVSGETQEATDALKVLFPMGTRHQGVYVVVQYVGTIVLQ